MDNHIELEIGPGSQPGRYQVRVVSSPVGGGQREEFPLDLEALMSSRPHLEASILASAVVARRVASHTDNPIRAIGQDLFEHLHPSIHRVYRASLGVARRHVDRLQVVLARFAAPSCARCHGRRFFDPEAEGLPLPPGTEMVRRICAQHNLGAPLPIDPPLCMLALSRLCRAQPTGSGRPNANAGTSTGRRGLQRTRHG